METWILNYRKNSKDEYSVKIGSIFCEEIRVRCAENDQTFACASNSNRQIQCATDMSWAIHVKNIINNEAGCERN